MRSSLKSAALFITVVVLLLQGANAYKALFIGAFGSRSHKNFYMGIIDELVDKGNQITLVTPYPSKATQANIREIIVPEGSLKKFNINRFREASFTSLVSRFTAYTSVCVETLVKEEVQSLLKEKFDVILISVFFNQCYLSFVHQLKIPLIFVSPHGQLTLHSDLIGNPEFTSFESPPLSISKHPFTFLQRTRNVVISIAYNLIFKYGLGYYMEWHFRNSGLCSDDMPSFTEIQQNTSLFIINSVKTLEDPPRPYVPAVVHAGGIHCRPAKSLPQDLEEWIEGAGEDGFIFFSLGSAVRPSDLPEENRQILVKVFGSLKQRVLWKWDQDVMPDKPPNVRLGKWLPQQDILGHPKLRLFITHGGILSTLESVYHGKPILGMPVFADQISNMIEVERQGWGRVIHWDDLSEEAFLTTIKDIMDNQKMLQEVKFRSTLMRDQPMSPASSVSYWVDYVVRHKGARHLRCPLIDMPWYKVYNIDVWTTLLVTLAVITFLSIKLAYLFFKCICRSHKAKKD